MSQRGRWVRCGLAAPLLLLLWSEPTRSSAQILYLTGQPVQPVYEGWNGNEDGSFTMWFGYMNRNYKEEPHVPTGPNNHFTPGPVDRGQPTHFYPRRQSFVFGVRVPQDWGDRNLVWTMTLHGQTFTAIGSLWDSWILDEGVWRANRGSGLSGRVGSQELTNTAPRIDILGENEVTATVDQGVTLTATASDDGFPGPRTRRARPTYDPLPNDLPTLGGQRSGGPVDQNMVRVRAAHETGLAVTWLHYRGPGQVRFSPMVTPVPPVDGRSTTSVHFSEPGTYVIRAAADDGSFVSTADVTVVVQ